REIGEAEGIEPIDRPDAKLTQLKEGEPLRYTATVVVRPDVALGDYLAHGATVEAAPPTEEDVDKTISSMRETHAQLRPVDREARPGDILTVDIDAAVPGKTLPPFARNEHLVGDLKARVKQEGVTWEKFLLQARKTEDDIRKEWRPVAERRAKSLLVLDAIARKEGITVSGDELAAQAAMSPLAQVDPQAL